MYQIDFHKPLHIHFIGIGGISMSGLAEILLGEDFVISGSDSKSSPLTQALEKKGATIYYGQRATNITDDVDVVVYTAAIHPDNPEFACAKEKGIPVCNVPAYGTASVSQFAIALLLELCHHIGHHSETVHAGRWANNADWCYWDYPMVELAGKTIGIIGFGRIGQATGRIAAALGMRVLAHSPHESDEGRRIGTYVDLDTLLRESDVISLHCPLTKDNAELIDRQTIAKMKDGALLVNNARGQLLNEQDVADALNSGKLAGAALDVVSAEPIHADNPLLSAKNCILTPHISWAPLESRQRIMDITAANIQAFLNGAPQNVVNK